MLDEAARVIRAGGVVAVATDTLVGLLALCVAHLVRGTLSSHGRFVAYGTYFGSEGVMRPAFAGVLALAGSPEFIVQAAFELSYAQLQPVEIRNRGTAFDAAGLLAYPLFQLMDARLQRLEIYRAAPGRLHQLIVF